MSQRIEYHQTEITIAIADLSHGLAFGAADQEGMHDYGALVEYADMRIANGGVNGRDGCLEGANSRGGAVAGQCPPWPQLKSGAAPVSGTRRRRANHAPVGSSSEASYSRVAAETVSPEAIIIIRLAEVLAAPVRAGRVSA